MRNKICYKSSIAFKFMEMPTKKVSLDLTEIDGNAFALLAAFRRQARREGWSDGEIKSVLDEARVADYDHLVSTLVKLCD
jgi:hypothetical protein